MRRLAVVTTLLVTIGLVTGAHDAYAETWLQLPVDGSLGERFEAPSSPYGPGHRGIDLVVAAGTLVRAAAPGRVTWAGQVGGRLFVAIEDGELTTTYSMLSSVLVTEGQTVETGTFIGRTGESHPGEPGLHLGVKLEGRYVDPLDLLAPLETDGAVHLIDLDDAPDDCTDAVEGPIEAPPNDNVVVAIAGIGSKTEGGVAADMYERGPEQLGYDPNDVYRFSYAGTAGAGNHEPYPRRDTYGSLIDAAVKLKELMIEIARDHPGRSVDVIAHSQGGVIASIYLQGMASGWGGDQPRVEHLVTLATPHQGAPMADLPDALDGTLTGGFAVDALSEWSRGGGSVPDPRSPAVAQLQPGSSLMNWLGREDVVYGTRVLTMTMPHDLVVPADRAGLEGARNHVLPPNGLWAHSSIVGSEVAREVTHAFLRDARPVCHGVWDSAGPMVGKISGWALPRALAGGYEAIEGFVGGRLIRAGGTALRVGGGALKWLRTRL